MRWLPWFEQANFVQISIRSPDEPWRDFVAARQESNDRLGATSALLYTLLHGDNLSA